MITANRMTITIHIKERKSRFLYFDIILYMITQRGSLAAVCVNFRKVNSSILCNYATDPNSSHSINEKRNKRRGTREKKLKFRNIADFFLHFMNRCDICMGSLSQNIIPLRNDVVTNEMFYLRSSTTHHKVFWKTINNIQQLTVYWRRRNYIAWNCAILFFHTMTQKKWRASLST